MEYKSPLFHGNPSSWMSADKYRESNIQKYGRRDTTKAKGASRDYANLLKKGKTKILNQKLTTTPRIYSALPSIFFMNVPVLFVFVV